MTTPAAPTAECSPLATPRRGRAMQEAAFLLLLACVAARCFLGELPFQSSALQFLPSAPATAPAAGGAGEKAQAGEVDNPLAYRADRSELSRVSFAAAILAAWALWAVGGAMGGGIEIRHAWLGVPIGGFAAATLVSALAASNVRTGLDGWIEQCSLLAGAWLAIQLFTDRRRFALLAVVLAAAAAALAIKGFWQVTVEIPDRAADFVAHRADRLAAFGWDPNTPQAELIEARMRDRSITGYMALANPFGSLLLVVAFAAVGVAADKIRAAARSLRAGKASRKKGEIDLPTLSAVLSVLAAAGAVVAIPLTHSRGAIISAAVAAVGLILLAMFPGPAVRHWRKCVVGALAALVLGGAAIVAYGLKHDSLPTKTMTFRWYYWTASASIFREHPVLGVGPGNFVSAYLQHRRAEAEEEVQMPHNLLAHALTEYGLPGGLCYLAAVGALLTLAARPRRDPPGALPPDGPDGDDFTMTLRRAAPALAAAVAAVLMARAAFSDAPAHPLLVVLDLLVPAGTLAAMLAVAGWAGPKTWGIPQPAAPATRLALLCGLAAFVLHNVVEYGLWMSGPATAFFVAAGACVAQAGPWGPIAGGGKVRRVSSGRWVVASAAVAAVVVVLVSLWLPVMRKTSHTADMLGAIRDGRFSAAWSYAVRAAEDDSLDPRPASDAAQVSLMVAGLPGAPKGEAIGLALSWADQAVHRDPQNATCHQLAGNIAWSAQTLRDDRPASLLARGDKALHAGRTEEAGELWARAVGLARAIYAPDQALAALARAVELNGRDYRLRLAYARLLCTAGRERQCLEQIDRAQWLDSRLPPESVQHLKPAERRDLDTLRARAQFLLGREAGRGPTTVKTQASK